MASINLFDSPNNGEQPTKEQIIHAIQVKATLSAVDDMITNINKCCFKLCVPNPGASFTRSEEASLERCTDKYMAAWDLSARTFGEHIRKQNS
ncbi:protein translocase subunit [Coemansia sp. RSA 564]|nr:protein translocase subunit [Coemansia sp. RSA 564]KAJ2275555.1 protein translocase subunit [Coemansia sp. RSA 371]KAJ2409509.1 protein translocase subunit [Coemansia sp. RSA 2526]